MIKFVSDDIFKTTAEAIVNTVNTEGIMGKGLALQFKKRFPENFKAYEKACKAGDVVIGKMFISPSGMLVGPKIIINFPTKKSWRNKSSIEDIQAGLEALAADIARLKIRSIAIPPLGCGLGGLSWPAVRAEIESALKDSPAEIFVYEPLKGKNPAPIPRKESKLTPTKALLLATFQHYMNLVPSVEISFVEAHKLAYLIQSLGLNLRLNFVPYLYGPYAKNLKFVFSDMEGTWIKGFRDGTGRAFDTFSILPSARSAAGNTKGTQEETFVQKLDDLIDGFESAVGLELLGTVHWAIVEEHVPAEADKVFDAISNWCDNKDGWGDRKKNLFSREMVSLATDRVAQIFLPSSLDISTKIGTTRA